MSPSTPTRKARRSGTRASWSRTTCRIGSNSTSPPRPPRSRLTPRSKWRSRALSLWRARGGARHRRRSQYRQGRRAAGLSRLFVRPRSFRERRPGRRGRHREHPSRRSARDRRRRQGDVRGCPRQGARLDPAARSQCRGASRGAWGKGDRAQARASRRASAPMIGVKPLFAGKSLSDNDIAKFDVVMVAPDGKPIAATGLKWQLLSIEFEISVVPQRRLLELRADQGDAPRRRRHHRPRRGTAGHDLSPRHLGTIPARSDEPPIRKDPRPRSVSIRDGTRKPPPTPPTCSKSRSISRDTGPATP